VAGAAVLAVLLLRLREGERRASEVRSEKRSPGLDRQPPERGTTARPLLALSGLHGSSLVVLPSCTGAVQPACAAPKRERAAVRRGEAFPFERRAASRPSSLLLLLLLLPPSLSSSPTHTKVSSTALRPTSSFAAPTLTALRPSPPPSPRRSSPHSPPPPSRLVSPPRQPAPPVVPASQSHVRLDRTRTDQGRLARPGRRQARRARDRDQGHARRRRR